MRLPTHISTTDGRQKGLLMNKKWMKESRHCFNVFNTLWRVESSSSSTFMHIAPFISITIVLQRHLVIFMLFHCVFVCTFTCLLSISVPIIMRTFLSSNFNCSQAYGIWKDKHSFLWLLTLYFFGISAV